MHGTELFDTLLKAITLPIRDGEKRAMVRWLIEDRMGMPPDQTESAPAFSSFEEAIRRINQHEPLQYILGYADFFGRKFHVNPAVLIPRPETELLVEFVVKQLGKNFYGTLLDIGTGSGCIAVTLALELPRAKVIATDIDEDALNIAARNARAHGVSVRFLPHDILVESLPFGPLGAIVSNPPYIRETEHASMEKNVTEYEPHRALFVPGSDPLLFHRAIAQKAAAALTPGGLLVMEINESLGNDTAEVVRRAGFTEVALLKDLDNKDRFVSGRWPA